MRRPFWTILALAAALAPPGRADESPRRPNILLIVADDLGYSDLSCYGGEIDTPNLDRLAANGLKFTQFTNTARCWPSRAAILTGYYPQQVNRDPQGTRPKWAALLPQLIEPAGYRSYHSGKWHIDGPVLAGGFRHSYVLDDHDRNFNPRGHKVDDRPLLPVGPDEGYYSTTAITDHALDQLAEHRRAEPDRPFFSYLCYTVPHFPLQAPAEDVAKYHGRFRAGWDELREARLARMKAMGLVDCDLSPRTPGVPAWDDLDDAEKESWQRRMEIHAAMVDRMDQEIGRVVESLRESGELENTLILFLSDNGASAERILRGDGHDPAAPPGSARSYLCLEPGWANLANAPFRKSKIFTHEGGISTPLIAHWPAGIAARGELRTTPGHLIDLAPTFLDLAGISAPDSWDGLARPPLPGRSLVPAFATNIDIPREPLYYKHQGNRALRSGSWKIVANGPDSAWELYDLAADRSETTDLSTRHPEKVDELSALWRKLDEEFTRQGTPAGPRPC